jgi:rhamnosyltransferase
MKNKKCSFILPTRNVAKSVGKLLHSIYSQDYEGEIEVLIQDSSDDNCTPQVVKQFPVNYVWVDPGDYNYGKTRNEGASLTDGEFLIFLSTDVEIVGKKWLSNLTRHFNNPKVAGVYGRQLPKKSSPPMEKHFILTTYGDQTKHISLQQGTLKKGLVIFSNTNTAVRRAVWEKIKIPEMLKSEDQEWAKRALLAGNEIVYDSEAQVYHSHQYTLKGVFQEYFDSGAAMPIVYDKGVFKYAMGNFIVDGCKFVSSQCVYLVKNRNIHWIPYALSYDFTKFMGIFLGSKQRHMPLWLKKSLCKKKNHWDKYSDVLQEPN